jgi:YD repeat-containing protein
MAFDANGNTQTMVNSSGTTTYAWDFENRLTSVTLPGSGGTVYFKYDPFGRRIYKSSRTATIWLRKQIQREQRLHGTRKA